MNDLIKRWGRVCLGSVAGAALGAASFVAVEALMPQVSTASTKGMSDYGACLYNKKQLNDNQPGLGDKSYDCERVRTWQSPQERVNAAGGRIALIHKCEGIWKPQLKNPGSYSFERADVIAKEKGFEVNVRYRARNSFNAVVPGSFKCNFGG